MGNVGGHCDTAGENVGKRGWLTTHRGCSVTLFYKHLHKFIRLYVFFWNGVEKLCVCVPSMPVSSSDSRLCILRGTHRPQSRRSATSLRQCAREIEIEAGSGGGGLVVLFVCVRNMNVCLHHMLNYCLCLCVWGEVGSECWLTVQVVIQQRLQS